MEKVLGIGGLFFRSKEPDQLARWYSENLGVDILDAVWQTSSGPTLLCPFHQDTAYFPPEQQWMINFRVANLDAMVAQLECQGVHVERRPDEWDSEVGRFARLYDPEGNPVELWEPGALD